MHSTALDFNVDYMHRIEVRLAPLYAYQFSILSAILPIVGGQGRGKAKDCILRRLFPTAYMQNLKSHSGRCWYTQNSYLIQAYRDVLTWMFSLFRGIGIEAISRYLQPSL